MTVFIDFHFMIHWLVMRRIEPVPFTQRPLLAWFRTKYSFCCLPDTPVLSLACLLSLLLFLASSNFISFSLFGTSAIPTETSELASYCQAGGRGFIFSLTSQWNVKMRAAFMVKQAVNWRDNLSLKGIVHPLTLKFHPFTTHPNVDGGSLTLWSFTEGKTSTQYQYSGIRFQLKAAIILICTPPLWLRSCQPSHMAPQGDGCRWW